MFASCNFINLAVQIRALLRNKVRDPVQEERFEALNCYISLVL